MKPRRKSKDNPNTRKSNDYFILFEKSVELGEPTVCLVKARFVKDRGLRLASGIEACAPQLIAAHTLVQSQPLASCFHKPRRSFARSPSAHWTLISTRRFFARPSLVLLSAIGLLSPNPCPETRPPSTPFFTT